MPEGKNTRGVVRKSSDLKLRKNGKNYLLVIGIDNYKNCIKLNNAVRDAKSVLKVLLDRFDFQYKGSDEKVYIKEYFDEKATKKNIFKALDYFAENVTKNDNFVIYFSGHGYFNKRLDLGYWIPVEADSKDSSSFIPNVLLTKYLNAINSHHTFVIADSCFSGTIFRRLSSETSIKRKERDPSRWGLSSGRDELVPDGYPGEHSPFAKSLIYHLSNIEEPLPVSLLCSKVFEDVTAASDQTPRGEVLKVKGHHGGEMVFHLRKKQESSNEQETASNDSKAPENIDSEKEEWIDSDSFGLSKQKEIIHLLDKSSVELIPVEIKIDKEVFLEELIETPTKDLSKISESPIENTLRNTIIEPPHVKKNKILADPRFIVGLLILLAWPFINHYISYSYQLGDINDEALINIFVYIINISFLSFCIKMIFSLKSKNLIIVITSLVLSLCVNSLFQNIIFDYASIFILTFGFSWGIRDDYNDGAFIILLFFYGFASIVIWTIDSYLFDIPFIGNDYYFVSLSFLTSYVGIMTSLFFKIISD